MKKYIIEGGKRLEGTTYVSGAKNAALPNLVDTSDKHKINEWIREFK